MSKKKNTKHKAAVAEENKEAVEEATETIEITQEELSRLNQHILKLAEMMERVRFHEYLEHLNDPKKMMVKSFISGMSRGLGMAVGFTVLGAILIQLLTSLANNNIPIISQFIADIIKTVEHYL